MIPIFRARCCLHCLLCSAASKHEYKWLLDNVLMYNDTCILIDGSWDCGADHVHAKCTCTMYILEPRGYFRAENRDHHLCTTL